MAIRLFSCVSAEAELVLYLSQDSRVTAHFPLKALKKTFQMTNFFKNMSTCTVTLSTHLAVSLRGMHLQFLMTSGSFRWKLNPTDNEKWYKNVTSTPWEYMVICQSSPKLIFQYWWRSVSSSIALPKKWCKANSHQQSVWICTFNCKTTQWWGLTEKERPKDIFSWTFSIWVTCKTCKSVLKFRGHAHMLAMLQDSTVQGWKGDFGNVIGYRLLVTPFKM